MQKQFNYMKKKGKIIKLGLFKPATQKWLERILLTLTKSMGETEIELTGLKIRIGKIEINFKGRTKLTISVKK